MARPASFRPSPNLSAVLPDPPAFAGFLPDIPRLDLLLEESRRAEALAIGLEEDLLDLQRKGRRRRVEQLEGADRMAEAEAAGGVDVLRCGDALLDQLHRLDEEGVQHAVDGEADDVLDADRRLAGAAAETH